MKVSTRYVGLDVHKSRISVAVAEDGRGREVRDHGVIENRADVLMRLVERLGRGGQQLHFCYEAGPCGYGLYRLLSGVGHDCTVVAPSLIPSQPSALEFFNSLLSCSLSRTRACLTCRQQPGKNFFSAGAQSRRQGPKTPVQQALMRGLDTAFPGFVLGLPRSRGERRSVDRLLTGTRVPHLALPPALSTSKKI